MKIAILAPENSPSWGGVGAYTYNLILHLPKDLELHVITLDRDLPDSYDKIISSENVTFHKIQKVSNKVFFSNLKFQIGVFKNLKKLNDIYNFDVIHTHSGHLPHFFSQFQKIDSKFVLTPHGETKGLVNAWKNAEYKNNTERLSTFLSPIIETGEKISFKKADRLFPVSQFTMNQIESLYNIEISDKSSVVYNGVNTNLFKPEVVNENEDIVITYIGRFYAIKGVNIFLEAIKKVIAKGYKIKIILAGRGDPNFLNKFLSKIPSDSYSLLNMVNHHNMKEIYNKSDIVVLPSLYEACPSTLLEAMSCGKVNIASSVGGILEIIEDKKNGLLFETSNSEDLMKKIIDILEGTFDTKKMGNNARKRVLDKFDWSKIGKQIYNEYYNVLKD